MKGSNIIFSAFTATWVVALAWAIWPIVPPIDYADGDTVWPKTVKVGGEINVTRTFTVIRSDPVTIIRAVVSGDCSISCETVDMPNSIVHLAAGHHRRQSRPFILPLTVDAGEWRIVFIMQWKDRIGRSHRLALKELLFTVVP